MSRLSVLFAAVVGLSVGALSEGCHGNCAGTHDQCDCASSHCNCTHDHCKCADGHCAEGLELGGAWACNVLWIDGQDEVISGDLLVYPEGDSITTLDRCRSDVDASDGPDGAVDAACKCLPLAGA